MTKTEVDRLGVRLRGAVTEADLTQLDSYRREFHASYAKVVDRIRHELAIEVSGRPAKSTPAIIDKLRRSSMRLSQMQDIAGCRIVVPTVAEQDLFVGRLQAMFSASVHDRRAQASYGYRAVHLVVLMDATAVEVQLRTATQHLWAELSEKCADRFGFALKYGGGPQQVRTALNQLSALVEQFERLERDFGSDPQVQVFKATVLDTIAMHTTLVRKDP